MSHNILLCVIHRKRKLSQHVATITVWSFDIIVLLSYFLGMQVYITA